MDRMTLALLSILLWMYVFHGASVSTLLVPSIVRLALGIRRELLATTGKLARKWKRCRNWRPLLLLRSIGVGM